MQTLTTLPTRSPRAGGLRGALAPAALLTAAALFLAGCASTGDDEIPALQAAESQFEELRATPRIDEFSRRSMREAQRHLQQARELAEQRRDLDAVEHHSFMAQRQLDIAQSRLNRGLNQEEIETADKRRQELMLTAEQRRSEQRRTQADLAQQRAEEAEARLALTQQELEQTREAAQSLASELDDLKVQQEERGVVLTLSDVVFDFDSDELNPGGEQTLSRVAQALQEQPNTRILVEGFTDATGGEDYNQQLSERRAESVKEELVKGGIPEDRIEITGHGEAYPVASNDTAEGRQMNRRVEIVVATGNQPVQPRRGSDS